jgi:hypothetical protein
MGEKLKKTFNFACIGGMGGLRYFLVPIAAGPAYMRADAAAMQRI